MNKLDLPSVPRSARGAQGTTLPEMMVAVGVGSLVLMVMAVIFTSSSRSFCAIGNYISMDQCSRNALDRMTRDIRNAQTLVSCADNEIMLRFFDSTNGPIVNLDYKWDASSGQLTRSSSVDGSSTILLTDCDRFRFSL